MPDDSKSQPPRRLGDFAELREIAAASLDHHFSVPWLLVPVFSSGLFLTGLFSTNVQPTAREDKFWSGAWVAWACWER